MSDPSPGPTRATTVRNLVLTALALVAVVSAGLFVMQILGPPAPTQLAGPVTIAPSTPSPAPSPIPNPTHGPTTAATTPTTAPSQTATTAGSPKAGATTATAPASPHPSFDIVRIGPQGSAVIAGRAAPNANVTILSDGAEVGHATADDQGAWALTPTAPLPPGPHQLTLNEQTTAGQKLTSEGSVLLTVPEQGPAAPLPPLAVLTAPKQPPRLLQGPPGEGTAKPGKLGLGALDYDTHGEMQMSGTAAPNSTVRLYSDNHLIGEVHTDKQGRWTLTPSTPAQTAPSATPGTAPGTPPGATQGAAPGPTPTPAAGTVPPGPTIAEGTHQLRLDQIGPNGKVTGRVELPFRREAVPPGALAAGHVIVQPGNNLWRIAYSAYGRGTRYTVIFQANRNQIRNPNLIYPGQLFTVPPGSP